MTMQRYHVRVEVDDRVQLTPDDVDRLMPVLEQYSGSPGMSIRGFRDVGLFVPADSLAQAVTTAAAVVAELYGAPAIACEAMTEKEFDTREGWMPIPEMVSVTEAAQMLGVSRQAVLDRITRGTLQAEKIGGSYSIPRGQLPATPPTVAHSPE